jgi:hypothetical protein
VVTFIENALNQDSPIAFLNLGNGGAENLDSWHWVTVIGIERTEDFSTATIDTLDDGLLKRVDLSKWYHNMSDAAGFVYFRGNNDAATQRTLSVGEYDEFSSKPDGQVGYLRASEWRNRQSRDLWFDDSSSTLVVTSPPSSPGETSSLMLKNASEVLDAIKMEKVRSTAVGIAAAYGVYLAVMPYVEYEIDKFFVELKNSCDYYKSSFPDDVILHQAMTRVEARAGETIGNIDHFPPEMRVGFIIRQVLEEANKMDFEEESESKAKGEV